MQDYIVLMLDNVGQQPHVKYIGNLVSSNTAAAHLVALCLGHAFWAALGLMHVYTHIGAFLRNVG